MKYTRSLKSFSNGAKIKYIGNINLYAYHRNKRGQIDYEIDSDLKFDLNIKYDSDKTYLTLSIYNETAKSLLFNRTIVSTNNSSLLSFLFPNQESVYISNYEYRLIVCPYPGPTHFGSIVGTPSLVGVPKEYLGEIIVGNNKLVITDNWWDEKWQCDNVVKRHDTGTFFRYSKLENGYMLLTYIAYYGAEVSTGNETIAEIFRENGSPLINMLVDTFGIDFLEDTVTELRNNKTLTISVVRESIIISESNVYPIDQDWGGGVMALYMGLTPLTQFLTIAAIVLLILYFRRR